MTAPNRSCPFCGAPAEERTCPSCQRDTTAARRPCQSCAKMIPLHDQTCAHCGAQQSSELNWKIPLIIAMFIIALVLSVFLRTL